MQETILSNARIVLRDEELSGSLHLKDGEIAGIDSGPSSLPAALDCEGDYVLPGFVELHSDNMEKHFHPRPGVAWPSISAAVAHDAQMAAAGVTTVFDAVRVGDTFKTGGEPDRRHMDMTQAIRAAQEAESLRADHLIHVRCEVSYEFAADDFAELADDPDIRLVSLMDHTPGQRQFVDVDKFALYYQGKHGLTDAQLEAFIVRLRDAHERHSEQNRARLAEMCRERGLPVASHDDATTDHVVEAAREGAVIAEFPTTCEAAQAARNWELAILMGAPNLVLGGSHSGNVSALELAEGGALDILSSDYVPASLLHGVFILAEAGVGITLSDAVAKASAAPARTVGLTDRGEIAPGRRADVMRVTKRGGLPVVTRLWRRGERVL